jgi:hypothetical protein
MLRALGGFLRLRRHDQPRQRACERTSEISQDDHRVSLRAFFVSLTPTGSHPPIFQQNLIPRRAPAPVSGTGHARMIPVTENR